MNTVQDEWIQFEKMVIALDAPDIQVKEMKLAFFGGATALLALSMRIATYDEDAAVEILEGLHDECERFKDEVT